MPNAAARGPVAANSGERQEDQAMADVLTDVLVAGYRSIGAATRDFDRLVARVKDKKVEIEGVILVTHDEDGNVSVKQTGDHVGREGAKVGRRGRAR
jgi:hypothetical protein